MWFRVLDYVKFDTSKLNLVLLSFEMCKLGVNLVSGLVKRERNSSWYHYTGACIHLIGRNGF